MKTNVSIKFNSIEEYREIRNKLTELGYLYVKLDYYKEGYILINNNLKTFAMFDYILNISVHQYNSLEEFLKD